VCLLLDVSSSMRGTKLNAAKRGAATFIHRLAGPQSSAALVSFSDGAVLHAPMRALEHAKDDLLRSLSLIRADGRTSLLDAVDVGLSVLDSSPSERLRALILLTDGQENNSSTARSTVEERLSHRGYLFFGIGFGEDADTELLLGLAHASGGHSMVSDEEHIEDIYRSLSAHL